MSPLHRIVPAALAGLLTLPATAMAAGMPQLNFATPLTISQVVWGSIIFVVLYILLSKVALPKVAVVLEERAAHIARDLEGAQAAKLRADAGMAEADAATAKARAESQAAINTALDSAKQAAAEQAEALNAALEQQLRDAETRINQARVSAMGALRQVATETAGTVVSRLTGASPDPVRLNNAVDAAMSARGVG